MKIMASVPIASCQIDRKKMKTVADFFLGSRITVDDDYSHDVLLSQFGTSLLLHVCPRYTCCFLTYIQISQEAGRVLWYSHLFKKFPSTQTF